MAYLQVSSLQIFSVNKLYCDFFSVSSCFPCFYGPGFSRSESEGLGPDLRSSPTIVHIFCYAEEKKCENKSKVHKVHKIYHYAIFK